VGAKPIRLALPDISLWSDFEGDTVHIRRRIYERKEGCRYHLRCLNG
jgi:hypothetical protein